MNSRIFVADDDAVIRELLRDLLESEGYLVELAADGQQALEMLRDSCPDLIITDMVMPRLDGAQLRAAARTEGCPARFILMSAMRKYGPIPDAAFLPKPFEIEHLLKLVERELAVARAHSDRS